MSDVKPLNIPRTALVKRLKEVAQEAEEKRNVAIAKAEAERAVLLSAIETLSNDQVANILHRYVGGTNDELAKWVEDKVENHKYETVPVEPSAVETSIEKQIRVLELASDETVEVRPTDSLYSYL